MQMPMIYSRLGSQTMEISGGAEGSLSVPFGNIGDNPNTLGLKGGWDGKRNVNVEALTGEKFLRAARRPISQSMFRYYWESGWQKEFLVKTFVSSITIDNRGPIYNDPDNYSEYQRFEEEARKLEDIEFQKTDTKTALEWSNFKVDPSKVTLADMIAADEKGYTLDGGYLAKKIEVPAENDKPDKKTKFPPLAR